MTIHPIGAPVPSPLTHRLQRAVAADAGVAGPAKPFTLAEKGVSPAEPPGGLRCPTGAEIMAEAADNEARGARMHLERLLQNQGMYEAESQRTQRLAAAVRAQGASADPLMRDIEGCRVELAALWPRIETARQEYAAAMDRLRQHQPGGRGVVSASA